MHPDASKALRNAFLPRDVPTVRGFDIAGGTSTEGEAPPHTLWDHVALADGRSGLLVLRAADGPVPPAFYVGLGRALFRGLAPSHDKVESLMAAVNHALTLGVPEATDQVLECALVVPGEDHVEWSSAGASPGGIIGREGTFVQLPSQGPPMGMMEGFKYAVGRYPMSVGDSCVTLSHASPGLFKGAADLVAGLVGKPVADVVATVQRAIREAQGGGSAGDSEVSVVLLRRS